ncbi:RluA family pseudouridine synthase [Thermus thermamylovorans]|uniref:Pseudouridine synthase n=1 Tax=Thermus thermamylovorans TaxID=2509362 RepID=A0A4Q9B6I3_9DEIN|nr:RluA family pseudouridine synthase [Thermus thermamylovorans]TBH21356.1 RluA family pseudouridine synthase [Thermus thermamylovorans]
MVRFRAEGVRLDQAVAEACGVSRARAQAWIAQGRVRVGEKVVEKAAYRLKGEEVVVFPKEERPLVVPEDLPIPVLYENEDLLVLNKPPGLLTHPAPGVYTGTVVNALLARHFPEEGLRAERPEEVRPGIVHRLDKDTSGLLVVAKHEGALEALAQAFRDRLVLKRYLAITEGHPREGTLVAPIGRHPVERHRMHIGGVAPRYAETRFRVLATAGPYALVEARPHTGRTHQIRVHLKHLKAPILGDEVYGRKSPHIGRQALHAYALRFPHPRTGRILEFLAPVPGDMVQAWEALGGRWPEGFLQEAPRYTEAQ